MYATRENEIVEEDMKMIAHAMQGETFDSLVLFGAFGKGEGCVIDGIPRNDYDLLIVRPSQHAIETLSKIPVKTMVEIMVVMDTPKDCTQQWYEIKYGSHLIAGKPLMLPDWKPYDIPFQDAVNSLEKRAISMILGKYEMMKERPEWRKVVEQICKGIIAVGDAQLIRRGDFHPSYAMRSIMLMDDEVGKMYQLAVAMKTRNFPEPDQDQIWELWNSTRSLMRTYMIENRIGSEVAELLFAINERHSQDQLKQVLIQLGAEKWL